MIVSSREQMQRNAPSSMIDDTDEGRKSSDNLENVDGVMRNLESTGSDNVEGGKESIHQYDRMTLRSRGKRNVDVAGVKLLVSK